MKVELSAHAAAQVEDIDIWWRENRQANPELFLNELDEMLRALEEPPRLGAVYSTRSGIVLRVLLRRTHYHLYFVEEKIECSWWPSGMLSAAGARGCS